MYHMDECYEDPSEDSAGCEFLSSQCIGDETCCCRNLRYVTLSECFDVHNVLLLLSGHIVSNVGNCCKEVGS